MIELLSLLAILATPTPTTTPALGEPGGPLGAHESSVAVQPAALGRRYASVGALFGVIAQYDVTDHAIAPQVVDKMLVPQFHEYANVFDPTTVWHPTITGRVYQGAATWDELGHTGINTFSLWISDDGGATWGDAIVIYQHAGPAFIDRPWLAISRTGRLWAIWNMFEHPTLARCVASSPDGETWSGTCTPPAPGLGPEWPMMAATGPNSAALLWTGPGRFDTVDCTAVGTTVACGPLKPGPARAEGIRFDPDVRMNSHPHIAAHAGGELAVTWAQPDQDGVQRVFWQQRRKNGTWRTPRRWAWWNDAAQFMPTIEATNAGDFVLTFYEQTGLRELTLRAVQYLAPWDMVMDHGLIGAPVDVDAVCNSLGDYQRAACAPQRGPCVFAYTGSNASTDCHEIRVEQIQPLRWPGCQLEENGNETTSWTLLGLCALVGARRVWGRERRGAV